MRNFEIVVHVLYDDHLSCSRCRKYTPDVGKLKQWPDLCLRCADAVEVLMASGLDVHGQPRDWQEWFECHEAMHLDNPLRSMPTTHVIQRDGRDWEMVYMDQETFKALYAGRLGKQ